MPQILDVQKLVLLEEPAEPRPDRVLECDVLVVGGGLGGCAAALAVCRAGRTVVLTEETDWLGGQLTAQGVSAPDEHRYIESFGGTRSYAELRARIRDWYRQRSDLAGAARREPHLNPGNGWVSRLCFEPKVGVDVLHDLLAPAREAGLLQVFLRHQAVRVETDGDIARAVCFRHLESLEHLEVRAAFVLDATELGDLLPLAGVEHRVGAESIAETGEPHAREEAADWCVQSFTYPFAVELTRAPQTPLPVPHDYELHRDRQPYTLRHRYYDERGWVTYRMFTQGEGAAGPFWTYRRLIDNRNFQGADHTADVAMINWPGNDFRHGNLLAESLTDRLESLRAAKDLALGFCRWLQTECPRDEGGTGYSELRLRPDVMGTDDGLARFPYIREGRRIAALRTVVEGEISAALRSGPGGPPARAAFFPDSVGVGLYGIDIHPCEGEEKIPPFAGLPFQIPLGALVPIRMRNLLPACKNIGTTHITNGAYRLHPVEWNIGESAGELAVFCLDRKLSPQTVARDGKRRRRLQRHLARAGIPLYWYVDVPEGHPAFEAVQVLAAWGICRGEANSLTFRPDDPADGALMLALANAPAWARERIGLFLEDYLARWPALCRGDVARAAYEFLSVRN